MESAYSFLDRCAVWMGRRLTSASAWFAWVLVRNERPVDNVWVQMAEKLSNPTAEAEVRAYLSNLDVTPEHRNDGVGTALLRAALDECASLNVDSVFLWPPHEPFAVSSTRMHRERRRARFQTLTHSRSVS